MEIAFEQGADKLDDVSLTQCPGDFMIGPHGCEDSNAEWLVSSFECKNEGFSEHQPGIYLLDIVQIVRVINVRLVSREEITNSRNIILLTVAAIVVTVTVVQVPDRKISDYCAPPAVACYKHSSNRIYIREIKNLNDYERLQDLGHEVYHLMGYKHD